jgi:hypothetical protein
MRESQARLIGICCSVAYASLIVWLYVSQPQTFAEVSGGLAASIGAYRIDQQAFGEGLRFFQRDQFAEARAAFSRADQAERDPRTQFYVAYSFYREGWGRLRDDDRLFAQGLQALDRASAAAPNGRIVVDDPSLGMHSADELRVELQRGMTHGLSALNPMRLFRTRK